MIDEQRYRALIQQLATGGITGNKTYHQYHDQFVPRDSESMGYAHGGGVGSMMKAKRGLVNEPGGYAGYEGNYYGGGRDYIGLNPDNAPIEVEDLTVQDNDGNFMISAANALENQDGIIGATTNIMEPGVNTIEGALINDDFRNDKIRSMVPERFSNTVGPVPDKAPWEGYVDLVQNPEYMPNRLQNLERFDDNRFEGDTTKNMRLKDEPLIAENWSPKDIFDMNTTLTGYQKFPTGAQWNNKDKYLKSDEYLQTLEPSLSGINTDKKGFNLSNLFPGKAIFDGIAGMLPKMDPRQKALREAYGYDNVGRVPQGELMAGYNPVSGGFLNTLTGGKFGKEPTYGLQKAYDKRINTINKTLAKWEADEDKYADKLKNTTLYSRRKALKKAKADELNMLNKVKADQIAEANAAAKKQYSGPVTYNYDPKQGGGGRPDMSGRPGGGFTNPGKGSYGPWKAHGGIISLKR